MHRHAMQTREMIFVYRIFVAQIQSTWRKKKHCIDLSIENRGGGGASMRKTKIFFGLPVTHIDSIHFVFN
jgi:hypothetical protein